MIDAADVEAGSVKIVAPVGFLEAAIAENVLAGNVMSRRASYMYGNLLPPDPKGQVGAGLGMTTSSGEVTLIPPTDYITETGQRMTIAGLDFEFMLAPETEAPSEMHWFIDQFKAVTAAEGCGHTLHNTYSIRGTKITDPLAWSKYLEQTIELWGDRAEVMYGMHHWPVWGRERVLEILDKGRVLEGASLLHRSPSYPHCDDRHQRATRPSDLDPRYFPGPPSGNAAAGIA